MNSGKNSLLFQEEEKHQCFRDYLKGNFWNSRLEYLTEIFTHLNSLNPSMQGKNENILTSTDKLISFQKKIAIWKTRAKNGNFEIFSLIGKTSIKEMTDIVVEHLTILEEKLNYYFPSLNTEELGSKSIQKGFI